MAADVPQNLIRAARRGVTRSVAIPHGAPPAGVFSEQEGPQDGQLASMGLPDGAAKPSEADALFSQLFAGGQPVAVATPSAAPLAPAVAPATPAPAASRAERFRAATATAGAGVAGDSTAPTPRAEASEPDKPWSRFVQPENTTEARTLRQSMAAAKVVTPLVAAVSFAPGSKEPGDAKSKALKEMLVGVHQCAVTTAEAISEHMGTDVPSWMVTQLMQAMSTAVATRWQEGRGADMATLASNMRSLFGSHGAEMDALVRAASEEAYVEVNHPEIARFRISVSAANAAWVLFDWVTHHRLSIDEKGDMPSRFFTYGQNPHDIVNKMLARCVNECRGLVAQVESADLRTAHMQSSIARMANLIGAEYVTRTRHVMNWIGDPSISDQEYQGRLDAAIRELDTRLLPEVYEYARVNFLRIEQGAFRTIEDLYEKTNHHLVPGGDARPASA